MRPRLLDLFCGAGGAAVGYYRAGFDVVGVDIKRQPRYPFEFIQTDAPAFLESFVHDPQNYYHDKFDAIHASPPCQDHMMRAMPGQRSHGNGWMLAATRDALTASGLPWVIENVPGARMRVDYELCGCIAGQPEVMRKRWFETSWHGFELRASCYHPTPVINTVRGNSGKGPWWREHGRRPTYDDIAAAMGIDWMRGAEVCQAIPPAYTQHLGGLLLEHLSGVAA